VTVGRGLAVLADGATHGATANAAAVYIGLVLVLDLVGTGRANASPLRAGPALAVRALVALTVICARFARAASAIQVRLVRLPHFAETVIRTNVVGTVLALAVIVARAWRPEVARQTRAAAVDACLVLILDLVRAGRFRTATGLAILCLAVAVDGAFGILGATVAVTAAAAIDIGLVGVFRAIATGVDHGPRTAIRREPRDCSAAALRFAAGCSESATTACVRTIRRLLHLARTGLHTQRCAQGCDCSQGPQEMLRTKTNHGSPPLKRDCRALECARFI